WVCICYLHYHIWEICITNTLLAFFLQPQIVRYLIAKAWIFLLIKASSGVILRLPFFFANHWRGSGRQSLKICFSYALWMAYLIILQIELIIEIPCRYSTLMNKKEIIYLMNSIRFIEFFGWDWHAHLQLMDFVGFL
ncbi:hypothetical protein ACJX0J_021802, partial [Zea mays]